MIINRLAVLMAERGLKITRVAKDTGISRNTITSTSQNDGEMIRLETINTLCKYLSITPCEFFEYEPVDFKFSVFLNDLSIDFKPKQYNVTVKETIFDLFMDIKSPQNTESIDLQCELTSEFKLDLISLDNTIHFKIEFVNEQKKDEFVNKTYSKISPSFHKVIYNDIKNVLHEEFKKKFLEDSLSETDDIYSIEDFEQFLEGFRVEINSDVFKPF